MFPVSAKFYSFSSSIREIKFPPILTFFSKFFQRTIFHEKRTEPQNFNDFAEETLFQNLHSELCNNFGVYHKLEY